MFDWIRQNAELFLCSYTDIGDSSRSAKSVHDEHTQFQRAAMVQINTDWIDVQWLKEFDFSLECLCEHRTNHDCGPAASRYWPLCVSRHSSSFRSIAERLEDVCRGVRDTNSSYQHVTPLPFKV